MMKIVHWNQLSNIEQQQSLTRAGLDQTTTIADKTQSIIDTVKSQGDIALLDFARQFDGPV